MRYLFIVLLLIWLLPIQAIAEDDTFDGTTAQEASDSVGVLHDAKGEVMASMDGQAKQSISKGDPLQNNMIISTGQESHAVLKFNDGQVIVLQSNTSFMIRDYSYNTEEIEKSNLLFDMLKGGLRVITGLIGSTNPSAFSMVTPVATIGIRGTDFMVVLDELDNQMYSQVTFGSITFENKAGTAVLNTGQTAALASAKTLPTLIKAEELPKKIFSILIKIPVPDNKPIVPEQSNAKEKSEMKETDNVAQAKRELKEKAYKMKCVDYGWILGTSEYDKCLTESIDDAQAKEKKDDPIKLKCEDYDWNPGTAEYDECVNYMKHYGYM